MAIVKIRDGLVLVGAHLVKGDISEHLNALQIKVQYTASL